MPLTATSSTIRVRIEAIQPEGLLQRSYLLAASDGIALPAFDAGAHIDVHIDPGLVRQYSLVSAPGNAHRYLLCVKRESASRGGSLALHERFRVGDELRISAPRNAFRLEPAPTYCLVAAGIGITPILSMAEELAAGKLPFVLHYYTRSAADTAFLARLQNGFASGKVVFHHSDQGDSLRHAIPTDILALPAQARTYVCGPDGFVERLRAALQRQGCPQERFHSESFVPTATAHDADDGAFEVALASSGQVFRIAAGQTISEVLEQAGIDISLSCEQGMCGACLTPVISGIPDHRDSVQSKKEKDANNAIAICCSRSKSARLTLDL